MMRSLLLSLLLAPFSLFAVDIPQVNYDEMRAANEKIINQVTPKNVTNDSQAVKKPLTSPISSDIDVSAIIDKFNNAKNNTGEDKKRKAGVYALVSLSVPQPILREIAKEIKRAGGVMVLRGFTKETSVKDTVATLSQINKGIDAQWSLDPDLFKSLSVEKVPAIAVMVEKNGNGCGESDNTDSCGESYNSAIAYGDVSVAHAMRRVIDRSNQKEVKLEAKRILSKLEDKF
jgi:type-F conjugative transfer system pilin assembly protein TrbC